jgi:hypothetical protein
MLRNSAAAEGYLGIDRTRTDLCLIWANEITEKLRIVLYLYTQYAGLMTLPTWRFDASLAPPNESAVSYRGRMEEMLVDRLTQSTSFFSLIIGRGMAAKALGVGTYL